MAHAHRTCTLAAALAATLAGPAAAGAATLAPSPSPWGAQAVGDLAAIHDILQANHPGAVDPQNHRFATWLVDGLARAKAEAARARSFSDYKRALLGYVNGFNDGHVAMFNVIDTMRLQWPGFLVTQDADGSVRVATPQPPAPLTTGDRLTACDGVAAQALLERWIFPYYANAEIPHARREAAIRLLAPDAYDTPRAFKTCAFDTKAGPVNIDLNWTRRAAAEREALEATAGRAGATAPGLREVDGVTVVSVPGFLFVGAQEAEAMRALIAEAGRAATAHDGRRLVIDLRGNHGGDSSWSLKLAGALWGDEVVAQIEAGFDQSTDWRVSPRNIATLDAAVEMAKGLNQPDNVEYRSHVAALLRAAQAKGQVLASDPQPPSIDPATPLPPARRTIYVFTDNACASACLDFMDIVRRAPGAVHIGAPTSADAVYIDNTDQLLPSGVARLSYSMKVYRHRVRGNNQWYEPQARWPGGEMSTEAIASWVRTLP